MSLRRPVESIAKVSVAAEAVATHSIAGVSVAAEAVATQSVAGVHRAGCSYM